MKQKLLILICAIMAAAQVYALEFTFENEDVVLKCATTSDNTCQIIMGGYSKKGILAIPETVEYNGNAYTVTSIGRSAFGDGHCMADSQITLPNTLLNIEEYAFSDCINITALDIPNSVLSIGDGAFFSCPRLETLTIGNSVQYIGESAFAYSQSLSCVSIPESVESIGEHVFRNGVGLRAFYGKFASDDNRCLVVDGVLNSFAPAGIETYEIPATVTSIGSYAFFDLHDLKSVTIPESTTSIGEWAFQNCLGLMSMNIPKSVIYIGDYAFSTCPSMESLKVENDNPANINLGDHPFNNIYKTCDL